METFIIEGGHRLTGDVTPAGNKNAALPLLAAVLLTEDEVVLRNVPRIGDVGTMLLLLNDMGVSVNQQGTTVRLYAKNAEAGTPAPRAVPANSRLDAAGRAAPRPLRQGGAPHSRRRPHRAAPGRHPHHGARSAGREVRVQQQRLHYDLERRAARRGHYARRGQRHRHRKRGDGGGVCEGRDDHPQRSVRAARARPLQHAQLLRREDRGGGQQHADHPGRRAPRARATSRSRPITWRWAAFWGWARSPGAKSAFTASCPTTCA